uniref:Uncharacterized protein n=1 Tax=Tanacetum cinerariifolium TaxID=118510 RepID=A0A6L2MZX1_TANCI|nr:hypothetical protein [Tanacetum cinerariifolium]
MDSCWTCGNPFHSYENFLEEIASRKEQEPEAYDYRSQYDAYEYDTHHTNYNIEMEDDMMYQGKDYAKIIKNQSKLGNIGHKIGSLHQKPDQQAFFYSNQPMKPKMSKDSKFKKHSLTSPTHPMCPCSPSSAVKMVQSHWSTCAKPDQEVKQPKDKIGLIPLLNKNKRCSGIARVAIHVHILHQMDG